VEEKTRAIALRKLGMSISEIAAQLRVSKGGVSFWVRDILLTRKQKQLLTAKGFSVSAIEKRRITRITKTKQKHLGTFEKAKNEVPTLTKQDLWLLGVSLYWGEGSKSSKGNMSIANSDPAVIAIIMRFFREVMEVPEEKFHCHVHTFSHTNAKTSEIYWSGITNIPLRQFYKTYTKPSSASKGKKYSLPHGTVAVYVSDTEKFWTIMGWIEGLKPTTMCAVPKRLL